MTTRAMPTFSFHLANITTADAIWLGQVCQLFADPAARHHLDRLRSGSLKLMYGPRGDLTLLAPVSTIPPDKTVQPNTEIRRK